MNLLLTMSHCMQTLGSMLLQASSSQKTVCSAGCWWMCLLDLRVQWKMNLHLYCALHMIWSHLYVCLCLPKMGPQGSYRDWWMRKGKGCKLFDVFQKRSSHWYQPAKIQECISDWQWESKVHDQISSSALAYRALHWCCIAHCMVSLSIQTLYTYLPC